MKIAREQLTRLLALIDVTGQHEVDCGELLVRLPRFVDEMVERGQPIVLPADLRHHLSVCGECLEEFEALLGAFSGSNG